MTSEGSGEIERLWWYAKRIVGVTEHQSITSSTLVPSEFEESEDNLLTLVLFNSMRSYVNPKIYWRLSLTRVASFNQKLLPPWSFQKDLLIDREYLIAANSSFNIDKKMNNHLFILDNRTGSVNNCIIYHSNLQPHQYFANSVSICQTNLQYF